MPFNDDFGPIPTDFNWTGLQDYATQPSDATKYSNQIPGSKPIDKTVNPYQTLSVGRYRLTIGNPAGDLAKTFSRQVTFAQYTDDNGIFIQKKVSVDAIAYDNIKNKVLVDITLYENPIPLFVIWGVVAGVVAIVGAMAVNSVLEKVEVLLVGEAKIDPKTGKPLPTPGIFDNVKDLFKSPITYGILAIFLLPLVFKGVAMVKK